MSTMNRKRTLLALLAVAAPACGDRSNVWLTDASQVTAHGLNRSVALVDRPADRALMLTVEGPDQRLAVTRLPVRKDVVATVGSADGSRLYLLTAGHRRALGDSRDPEAPALTVIEDAARAGAAPQSRVIDLPITDPLDALDVDPAGHWAVVHAGAASSSAFVTNPNLLVIVDLTGAREPSVVTLHSFGGRPERLLFTPQLSLPDGPGHLLLAQSQQELALLSLEHPERAEVTVRLTDASTKVDAARRVAQLVVDDGAPDRNDDARIGIRFDNDPGVMTLQLEAAAGGNGFAPAVNLADVGGLPSDLAFVRTDGGLRLAALVPGVRRAVLIDPVTTITTDVDLPAPYARLSLVTGPAGGGPAADVALLWEGSRNFTAAGVAFWELGQAAGRPFRSIETAGITAVVSAVIDVPARPTLRVLATENDNAFYILDLETRTAAPLLTATQQVGLVVSPTGDRVWTFAPGGSELAATEMLSKRVRTLHADTGIDGVFEIERHDGNGRSLIALHAVGAYGATIYDADKQDEQQRRIYGALLVEGTHEAR